MYRHLPLLLIVALIPGCGLLLDLLGLDGWGPFGPETGSPQLKAFTSEQELADYFAQQIAARNDQFADVGFLSPPGTGPIDFDRAEDTADGLAGTIPTSEPSVPTSTEGGDAGTSDTDFSQTTIQEEGVDEADVVKTDGTYLYIINSADSGSLLRIVNVSPPEAMAVVSETALEGFGREIYLHDGKVVALTESGGGFFRVGDGGIMVDPLPADEVAVVTDVAVSEVDIGVVEPGSDDEFIPERPRTIVTVIDASTPGSPSVLSQTRFDGSQSSSRMIDGVLYMVVSNYQDYYYDVLPLLGQPELDVSTVDVETLLPTYEHIDAGGVASDGNVLTWREMYRPTDPDGFGVVSAVSLDVDNNAAFTAVGVVAEPGLIYSSLNALYLTDTEFEFFGDTRETTDIYKFAYQDRAAVPVAQGSVPGRILNQYSMGEYEGHLRIATTVGRTFSSFGQPEGPFNNVYVLTESEGTLEVVGSISNLAPGETIRSARFVGSRGYLVTFEEIDPLFTLDLSDHRDPRVVGELKVPGFSTFIVPIDTDHLLAVGQYIPEGGPFFGWGVQLSIFDVSDFANPELTANKVLGAEGGASSEALYNPKAFTYFAERGLVALPVSIYEDQWFFEDAPIAIDDGGVEVIEPFIPQGFEGLVVYSVSAQEGLTQLGRISTRFEDAGAFWSSFTRGVFIADDLFAVTDNGVRGAPLSDLESIPYELLFE